MQSDGQALKKQQLLPLKGHQAINFTVVTWLIASTLCIVALIAAIISQD